MKLEIDYTKLEYEELWCLAFDKGDEEAMFEVRRRREKRFSDQAIREGDSVWNQRPDWI